MARSTISRVRCAVYTRKSSEEGLEQEFNSLHAQREACEAFIASQRHEGWTVLSDTFDDGGFSGGTMERPGLQQLLFDIKAGWIDVVVVYKIDRLTRSLFDFAKIVEVFDAHDVSFVSVTQSFNTTTSMGRLTLNVLLSFAQFEREVTGERIRDKIAASKKKGMWMGGNIPLGFDLQNRKLVVNQAEAATVRKIYGLYEQLRTVRKVKAEADRLGMITRARNNKAGVSSGGMPFRIGHLYTILRNPLYAGLISHKGQTYPGEHDPIVDAQSWDRVQSQLGANAKDRMRSTSASQPSLLKGLLFDDRDNPMIPSHAVKNGKRYRYYISGPLVRGTGQGIRVPAGEIEGLVTGQIRMWLSDPLKVLEALSLTGEQVDAVNAVLVRAGEIAGKLNEDCDEGRIQLIRSIVTRVVISDDVVAITVDTHAIAEELNHTLSGNCKETIQLECRANIKRLGKQTRLVIAGQSQEPKHEDALIKAIVRAHRWFDMLKRGEVQSIAQIAKTEGLQRTYVSSLIPLAFLAPDIVEMVLQGSQPEGVTLDRILKLRPMPMLWNEQRNALGFAAQLASQNRYAVKSGG